MLAMPRFVDGAIDVQELLRRLAEQVVNAVMDAETDQLCGGWAKAVMATESTASPPAPAHCRSASPSCAPATSSRTT